MTRPETLADAMLLTRVTMAAYEPQPFGAAMVDYLETWIGHGEEPGLPNNTSAFIRMMRSTDGTGKPVDTGGSWCGVTVSHAGVAVATARGVEMPFEPNRGARKVTKNIAAAGSWIVKPGRLKTVAPAIIELRKGDVICFRGEGWRGHVMIVVSYDATDTLVVIEGNKTNRKVRIDGKLHRYAVIDYRTFEAGSWRPKLFGVAGLR